MASYNRFMRRAMARGKKPGDVAYKENPHGGHPAIYERKDYTAEGFAGKMMPQAVKGFNPFTEKGGKV